MKPLTLLLGGALVFTSGVARADFTYQETTQITGGSITSMMKMASVFSRQARQANEPIVTTVMVKGNRMIRSSKDESQIIDLDAGTITTIDHIHKQYTTLSFEQMRRQMELAMERARADQAKQQQQAPPTAPPQNIDVKFNVKVRYTGAEREVAGISAKESILAMTADAADQTTGQTGSLAITNDIYLAPAIPGYEEVQDFQKRYAEKLGITMNGAINPQVLGMMQQPAASKGMASMVEELSKLKGVPVLQIMRMGTTANGVPLPAASEAPLPAGAPTPTAGQIAKQSATDAVMSSLPFGGFGRKKKQDATPPAAQNSDQPAVVVLVESTTQITDASRAEVDASQFSIPPGYQQTVPRQVD